MSRWPGDDNSLHVVSSKETPVGVEPTSIGLQPIAVPSGSSVMSLPAVIAGSRDQMSLKVVVTVHAIKSGLT